jgi:hypothetical protein
MRNFHSLVAVLSASALLGCVQTTMKEYADRDLPSRPMTRVVTYVTAPLTVANELQSSIANEAAKRGMVSGDVLEIFPPTRSYDQTEIRRDLASRRVDAVLIINVGDSGVIRQYAGTVFSGQYDGSFSADGNALRTGNLSSVSLQGTSSGTWSGSSAPVYRHSRSTQFTARLIEPSTNRTLWTGQGAVNASGRLFVGDRVGAANAASAIFSDLQSKGLVEGPK